jgi:Subtilase family
LAIHDGTHGAVPGNGVADKTGTSFACPIVTGGAALLLSLQKSMGQKLSPKAVRDAIIESAVPCAPEQHAQCERMLGGRINISGASDLLFKDQAVG